MALLTQRRRTEHQPIKTIYVTSLDELATTLKSLEAIQAGYLVRSFHNTKIEMSSHYIAPQSHAFDMYREPYHWWEIDIFRGPRRADWPLGNDGEAYENERFGTP